MVARCTQLRTHEQILCHCALTSSICDFQTRQCLERPKFVTGLVVNSAQLSSAYDHTYDHTYVYGYDVDYTDDYDYE